MRFMVETASTGNLPAADSADSMMASAPSYTAVATSETSARVGTGDWIIDSSIWVATTTGVPGQPRHLLLQARHPFQWQFDAEIAARHHQGVGRLQDFREPIDRLRLFDLGHDRGAAADQFLGLDDVLGALHERQRHPVDSRHY